MDIQIREDFRKLIPPLSKAERDQLEKSLLAQGRARDPLVVWKGEGVLLDGHNRFDFCTEKNLPFDVTEVRCSSEQAAKNWIILNQLGRRNLSPKAAKLLRGKLYNARKKSEHDGGKGRPRSEGNSCPHSTAAQVAKETGVSERTVKNDGKFAEAVEEQGVEADVLAGRETRTPSQVVAASENRKPTKQKRKRTPKPLHDRVCDALNKLINGFKESERDEVKAILSQQILSI